TWDPWTVGLAQRLVENLPEDRDHDWVPALSELARRPDLPPLFTQIALGALARQPRNPDAALPPLRGGAYAAQELEMLRRHRSEAEAQTARQRYLRGEDALARAAALEDLKEAPADLEVLVARLWKVDEYDGVQMLLASLEKWKMPEAARKALLTRFLKHPCWTARLDAWRQLRRLAPATPWPETPKPTYEDRVLLKEAARLLAESKPLRLRLTFAGSRTVTLKLDAANAPMNVANLVRLARLGFFNQRRAPRVVPDFVVQMGSPVDTMDGGPGYTVRCENSLHFYGPGSVGMALSGMVLSGKDTGGCQFFITTNATPHLTGRYTRVGEVEDPDRALPLLDALEPGARLERVEVLSERKM
ncbi:MAG: peptidylprolyl isomerase, partial [Firmicutes bacterium]|nr:peptidylprolyl isomerase [Bacillota bacterium]